MFKFDLQLFGGGGESSTTTRNIPEETADEAKLKNGLMGYNTTGLNNAANILGKAVSSIAYSLAKYYKNIEKIV